MKSATAIFFVVMGGLAAQAANNGFETIRIPTPISPKCINSKTDQVTLSVYRVAVEKTGGFFTSDNQAGVAVISTLNADAAPQPAKTPSVNLVPIAEEHKGQVFLALEYPIASRFLLTQNTGAVPIETKSILLEMYLEKTRGADSFGKILTTAGSILGQMPIPANPYLAVANQFINFTNQTILSETAETGAKLFATVNLQFADRDYSDLQSCKNAGGEATGAIAVVAATGAAGPNLLALGNLSQRYCFRYSSESTYEVQYATKPAAGCAAIPETQWAEIANDYVMLLLSAATANPPRFLRKNAPAADFSDARVLCDSLRVSRRLCGVD